MKKEKTCENCRYYKRHYVVNKFGNFMSVCFGHCVNSNIKFKERDNRVKNEDPCELWEPQILQKQELRKNIEATLRSMEERLSEIAFILKDED